MLLMPFFFRPLGVKKLMLLGMAAWGGRYVLFALGASSGVAATTFIGILLHGICCDFFFAVMVLFAALFRDQPTGASAPGSAPADREAAAAF